MSIGEDLLFGSSMYVKPTKTKSLSIQLNYEWIRTKQRRESILGETYHGRHEHREIWTKREHTMVDVDMMRTHGGRFWTSRDRNKESTHDDRSIWTRQEPMVANVDMTRIQGGRFEHGENQRWQLIMSPLSFTSFLF